MELSKYEFDMKTFFLSLVLVLSAQAQTYSIFHGSGTSSVQILVPGFPAQTVKIVGAVLTSDKATSVLDMRASDLTTQIMVH